MASSNDDVSEDLVETIHSLINEFREEGFKVTDCSFCVERVPKKEPRACPVCSRICYPIGQLPH